MPISAHNYTLGREQSFNFVNGLTYFIANRDIKTVTCTFETSAEADVTTRASGNESEFYPVRRNTGFEVVCLAHSCAMHSTGTVFVSASVGSLFSGITGATGFGHFYVNNISEPHENDGAIEYTISLRRTAIFSG
jgi:hypothetical protein